MPILRSMRLFNAIESNEFTSATLEALLADQGRRSDLDAIAADRALMRRFAETPAAAAVVLGSTRGRASVFASTVAIDALCGSRLGRDSLLNTPTVAAALAASAVGMRTLGESVICKMALSESNVALAAVLASTTALDALRAAPLYAVTEINNPAIGYSEAAFSLPGERYIVLGASASSALNMSVTLKTVTASSGSNTIAWTTADAPGTTARTKSGAIGIKAPYLRALGQNYPVYLGLLRCDA